MSASSSFESTLERTSWAHWRVVNEVALLPFHHRLRVHTVTLAQLLDRSFRSLYRSSDSVRGRGANVKYLSDSDSINAACTISSRGFSTESDWFLEFHNQSLKHIGISDFQ